MLSSGFCLRAYSAFLTLTVPGVLLFAAQDPDERPRFEEIDVERINIIESDGTIKLVLSNQARSPGGTLDGKEIRPVGERTPGLYFFNGAGDECGGLTFSGGDDDKDGEYSAFGSFTFDRFRSDQVVAMQYSEREGLSYETGLSVWDRPPESLPSLVDLVHRRDTAKGEERKKLEEELGRRGAAGEFGLRRMFVGSEDGIPTVSIRDAKGNPRLQIMVDKKGEPVMRFFDADGGIVHELPPREPAESDR